MKYRLLLAPAALLLTWGLASALLVPLPKRAQPIANDTQDFVYLGPTRPVLVRLHVQLNGKAYRTAWDAYMKELFTYLDVNGDGVLNKDEAARVPWMQLLFNSNSMFNALAPPAFNLLDTNKDGKVTLAELSDFYRRAGASAFQFQLNPGPTYQDPGGRFQVPLADALTDALFARLDTNKDGKLSKEELARTPATLLELDADEDEMITVSELLPNANQVGNRSRRSRQSTGSITDTRGVFVLLNPGDSPAALTLQLQTRYGPPSKKSADKKLTCKDLGLDQPTFDWLDKDKNGVLDKAELDQFANRPPDLELMVRLGQGGHAPPPHEMISLVGKPVGLGANLRQAGNKNHVLDFGTVRLELRGQSAGEPGSYYDYVVDFFKQQFKEADKDNNGYLDAKEANQNRFYKNVFKMMDRNGDGKLYEKEVDEFFKKMTALQQKAKVSCVALGVTDLGRSLFELIDTNRDGRLSVREMRHAVNLVAQLDRDGDGQLSRAEIPQDYQLALIQGPSSNLNQGGVMFFNGYQTSSQGPPPLTDGPLWFRKMDRNRDGDVSRKEFLGSDEEFRQLDTDGDGLISLEEAKRADQRLRKQQQATKR